MKRHTIYGLLIIVALVFCLSVAPSANASSAEEEVLQLISDYFKGWNTNDNKLMASVHWNSPDMSFFGSGKDVAFLTKGWEETAELFKSLFENPPGTFSVSYYDPTILMIEDNVAVVTMYAIFTNNPPIVAEQQITQERITQVVKKIKDKWQIVHIHWSIFPTE
jgi:uncharacterized protein (TIGR02246 family)